MFGNLLRKAFPKLISAKTHSAIDYAHAGTNFAAAAILRNVNRDASNAALGLGLAALLNAALTEYPLGIFHFYGFKTHGVVDYGIAAAAGIIPNVLEFKHRPEAKFFRAQATAALLIADLSDYRGRSRARRLPRTQARPRVA
jgi:hypothetical protein